MLWNSFLETRSSQMHTSFKSLLTNQSIYKHAIRYLFFFPSQILNKWKGTLGEFQTVPQAENTNSSISVRAGNMEVTQDGTEAHLQTNCSYQNKYLSLWDQDFYNSHISHAKKLNLTVLQEKWLQRQECPHDS